MLVVPLATASSLDPPRHVSYSKRRGKSHECLPSFVHPPIHILHTEHAALYLASPGSSTRSTRPAAALSPNNPTSQTLSHLLASSPTIPRRVPPRFRSLSHLLSPFTTHLWHHHVHDSHDPNHPPLSPRSSPHLRRHHNRSDPNHPRLHPHTRLRIRTHRSALHRSGPKRPTCKSTRIPRPASRLHLRIHTHLLEPKRQWRGRQRIRGRGRGRGRRWRADERRRHSENVARRRRR